MNEQIAKSDLTRIESKLDEVLRLLGEMADGERKRPPAAVADLTEVEVKAVKKKLDRNGRGYLSLSLMNGRYANWFVADSELGRRLLHTAVEGGPWMAVEGVFATLFDDGRWLNVHKVIQRKAAPSAVQIAHAIGDIPF